MSDTDFGEMPKTCQKLRPESTYAGKQGLNYIEGIAQESTDPHEQKSVKLLPEL